MSGETEEDFKCFSRLAHQERAQSPSTMLADSGKDL